MQQLREVEHIDIKDTEETSETWISDVLQLVLLIDIQVFVKRKVSSILTCQLSVRLMVQKYAFLSKKMFSFNFQLTVSFLFIIRKL